MNRLQYLLTKLAEESLEIGHPALKAQQFGLDMVNPKTGETNKTAIQNEIIDLMAIVDMLSDEFGLFNDHTDDVVDTKFTAKKEKVNKYFAMAKERGFVR